MHSRSYQIKDVAERSGFAPSTLRYYEQIGLLPPSLRTAAGYREYHEETIDRLAFIARAKQLGCSLDEIIDLTQAWTGGQCGPLQDRLRHVVAEKLAGAQQHIDELQAFAADLRRVAKSFDQHRPDGPCDTECGCVSSTDMVSVTPRPALSHHLLTRR